MRTFGLQPKGMESGVRELNRFAWPSLSSSLCGDSGWRVSLLHLSGQWNAVSGAVTNFLSHTSASLGSTWDLTLLNTGSHFSPHKINKESSICFFQTRNDATDFLKNSLLESDSAFIGEYYLFNNLLNTSLLKDYLQFIHIRYSNKGIFFTHLLNNKWL